jgi:hypothetical protein
VFGLARTFRAATTSPICLWRERKHTAPSGEARRTAGREKGRERKGGSEVRIERGREGLTREGERGIDEGRRERGQEEE